ncbi:MAG TPA: choice-of-anchor J domain-containing protein [Chitinophagaceae bacterium]|nr:choice-of-anchor J domain-containing protein [Chitinophagaceae bacterium]
MKKIYLLLLLQSFFSFSFGQITSLHENFSTCITGLPNNWQKYNVTGSDSWQCTSAGQTSRGIIMSGYSGGMNNTNEDWVISPQIDLNLYTNPMLSFWCRTKYSGPFIQVLISNNYSGSGNPNSATWNTLPAVLPTASSDVWFLSDNISLLAYKSQPFFIAFKYISNTSAAATWKVDEVNITDGSLFLSKKFINVGQTSAGLPSASSPLAFTMSGGITSFTASVQSPFEISSDGINYNTQLNYNPSISGNTQFVYLRINPNIDDKVYRSELRFILNGNILSEDVKLLGTSLPDDKTLRVYTWNMRWFGDPGSCSCDTNEARLNATQILKDINADIYCLQEVVSASQIGLITSSLGPKYSYIVSPYCSFATSTSSSNYGTGQKLAYIYNTDKIENLGTFGLLASTYPSDTSTNSGYYCFASGRFPFVLKAKLKLKNGLSDSIIFSNIHAKAISDIASYNRRECGAIKMTDSLNSLFPNNKIIVLGDYNDYLEGTTVSSLSTSPYQYMLNHGFEGITLPSKYPNQTTYVGSFNNIIDNICMSNNLNPSYPDSSCFIFSEVENYINNYSSSTSDHLPVISYFKFNFNYATNMDEVNANLRSNLFSIQNPSTHSLNLFLSDGLSEKIKLNVYDITGKLVFRQTLIKASKHLQINLNHLHRGMYIVEIDDGSRHEVKKWMVIE